MCQFARYKWTYHVAVQSGTVTRLDDCERALTWCHGERRTGGADDDVRLAADAGARGGEQKHAVVGALLQARHCERLARHCGDQKEQLTVAMYMYTGLHVPGTYMC